MSALLLVLLSQTLFPGPYIRPHQTSAAPTAAGALTFGAIYETLDGGLMRFDNVASYPVLDTQTARFWSFSGYSPSLDAVTYPSVSPPNYNVVVGGIAEPLPANSCSYVTITKGRTNGTAGGGSTFELYLYHSGLASTDGGIAMLLGRPSCTAMTNGTEYVACVDAGVIGQVMVDVGGCATTPSFNATLHGRFPR